MARVNMSKDGLILVELGFWKTRLHLSNICHFTPLKNKSGGRFKKSDGEKQGSRLEVLKVQLLLGTHGMFIAEKQFRLILTY